MQMSTAAEATVQYFRNAIEQELPGATILSRLDSHELREAFTKNLSDFLASFVDRSTLFRKEGDESRNEETWHTEYIFDLVIRAWELDGTVRHSYLRRAGDIALFTGTILGGNRKLSAQEYVGLAQGAYIALVREHMRLTKGTDPVIALFSRYTGDIAELLIDVKQTSIKMDSSTYPGRNEIWTHGRKTYDVMDEATQFLRGLK